MRPTEGVIAMTGRHGDDGHDDYDARFADIVSRWDEPPSTTGGAEDDGGPRFPTVDPARSADSVSDATEGLGTRSDATSAPHEFGDPVPWRLHTPPEDEDEGYVPPPPSPLPSVYTDWPFYVALVGLVGGPLWLIYLAIFDSTEHSLMWTAGALTIAGFVTLVLRQPRDREDDGDDGARV